MTDDLRTALEAVLPTLTEDQARAASDLLDALTPPMEEPTWPGAVVMTDDGPAMRTIREQSRCLWYVANRCFFHWSELDHPRPLTDDERAKYGIPMPAEPITDELVDRCIEATDDFMDPTWSMEPSWVRAVLRAAGHPKEQS